MLAAQRLLAFGKIYETDVQGRDCGFDMKEKPSVSYETKISVQAQPLPEFIAAYQHQEKYLAYCKDCKNYGARWSCPPLGFNVQEFLLPYRWMTVAAVQILFSEETLANTEEKEVKEVSYQAIFPVKDRLHDAMLLAERKAPQCVSLSSGGCTLCPSCTRPDGLPCRQPQRMRYSLDSFGFDLAAITENLLGIQLLWCRGKLPAYYTLIHALLGQEAQVVTVREILRETFAF